MSIRHFYGLSCFVAVVLAGCAHSGPQFAGDVPSWTGPLEARNVSASVDNLADPRDYTLHQVSVEGGAVANEATIAELEGPGAVVRLFVEEPNGRVALYVDDNPEPIFLAPFPNLFMSTMPGFEYPISTKAGGGSFSYVPVPYLNSCRIVYVGPEPSPACQITYATFDDAEGLVPFQMAGMAPVDKKYFQAWDAAWKSGMDVRLHDLESEKLHHTKFKLYPRQNKQVIEIPGPATITELEIMVGAKDPNALDHLWLAIYWDAQLEPAVLAPLSGFFGSLRTESDVFGGPALGREGNRMWCRFPMPFSNYSEVRIVNTMDDAVDFEYNLTWRPGPVGDARYFHARYNEAQTRPGEPYTVARISGRGQYVGTVMSVSGAESDWFLAGAENIYVDGAPTPQISGNGTGRYFNAQWAFARGPFIQPMHGVTMLEGGAEPYGFAAYRVHAIDAIPFTTSLDFAIVHGAQNNQAGLHYESVAFWYQEEPATASALWPVQAVALKPRPDMQPAWAGPIAEWRGKSDKQIGATRW